MPSLQWIKYDIFLHTLTAGTEKANKYILTRTEGGTSTTTSDAIIYRVARFHATYAENYVSSPSEASCFVAVYSVYEQHYNHFDQHLSNPFADVRDDEIPMPSTKQNLINFSKHSFFQ